MAHPLSVSTALFDGHSFETAIHEIAASGAAGIEFAFIQGYIAFEESSLTTSYGRKLGQQAVAAGLQCHAVSAHMDLGSSDAVAMLQRRLEFAHAVGARILITNSSLRPQRHQVLESIDGVQELCRELNVVIALENPGDGVEQLIRNAADGAALVREIDSPWVRFNYDVGNVYTYSDAKILPQEDIAAAAPFLTHIHFKDIILSRTGWSFSSIGDGELDWPAIMSALDRFGPSIPIGLEMPLRAARPDRNGPVTRRDALTVSEIRRVLKRSLSLFENVMTPP
jgi:sugar phosphate isomerase/epimerase